MVSYYQVLNGYLHNKVVFHVWRSRVLSSLYCLGNLLSYDGKTRYQYKQNLWQVVQRDTSIYSKLKFFLVNMLLGLGSPVSFQIIV